MNTQTIITLFIIALIPVVVSVIVYILETKFLKNANYWLKQILIGILFGGLSILGSEFGCNLNGATINVRDAAPIIAGFTFGGPAGIIAGFMGGIERWLAVAWGAGTYTRVACSISTCVSGIFAAILRRNLFDGKIPRSAYAFVTGIIMESFHMLMVFITHIGDPIKAYEVVNTCTIPMVSINSFAIALAVFLIHRYRHLVNGKRVKKTIDINRIFQKDMMIVVLIAFIITNLFSIALQNTLAYSELDETLEESIIDVLNDVSDTSNNMMLLSTQKVVNRIDAYHETVDNDYLTELAKECSVDEINIINREGIITLSTVPEYIGFNMYSGEQSKEFMDVLKDSNYFAQEIQATTYDNSENKKFAAMKLATGNIVQVGYSEELYYQSIEDEVYLVAKNRHIGTSGGLIIIEEASNTIVSDNSNRTGRKTEKIFKGISIKDQETYTRYRANFFDEDWYYMFDRADGYLIIAYQSVEEALIASNISLYLTTFLQVLVFASIFIIIFIIIRKQIVNGVREVNKSLVSITEGELDTVLNVKHTREFEALSNSVNMMVTKLKQLIHESEEKMKQELEYAAEIQRSALPSQFPAFPDRDEFDIYASMDPAKEVGGDFYDFYLVEGDKLAILIADVSGKGIPASLFMMKAKAIIKSYAQYGIAVNDVFTNANYNLCEGNDAGLFVTAWMALIDLKTGHVTYANAGHNPPLIKKPNGQFEYLRSKAGFVLGGMEGICYKAFEFDIEEGTEIFVYTDGLTEAQNIAQELYGEERLLKSINTYEFNSSEDICKYVKKEVDAYVGEADQFDDLTMLHFKFIRKM